VGDWIVDIGFPELRNNFVSNYISGLELIELEPNELKDDLEVTALGARKAIIRNLTTLKEQPS